MMQFLCYFLIFELGALCGFGTAAILSAQRINETYENVAKLIKEVQKEEDIIG